MYFRSTVLIAAIALANSACASDEPAGRPGYGAGGGARMLDGMFLRLDTNADGAITVAEIQASREALFARADADGDGFISGDELSGLSERPGGGEGGQRRGPRGGGGQGMGGMGGDPLTRYDVDGDGQISRAEFASDPNPMLMRADTDGDGRVTRAELESAMSQMRGRRGQ